MGNVLRAQALLLYSRASLPTPSRHSSTAQEYSPGHSQVAPISRSRAETSAWVGFWPSERRSSPRDSRGTSPVPFLSKSAKASRYSVNVSLTAPVVCLCKGTHQRCWERTACQLKCQAVDKAYHFFTTAKRLEKRDMSRWGREVMIRQTVRALDVVVVVLMSLGGAWACSGQAGVKSRGKKRDGRTRRESGSK